MLDFDNIRLHLPQYLTDLNQRKLLDQIDQFTEGNQPLYNDSFPEADHVYQGDGLNDLLVINLPSTETDTKPSLVISNSCDVNPENPRLFPHRLVYAPLVDFQKLSDLLFSNFGAESERVKQYLGNLEHQHISNAFYLPASDFNRLEEPKVAFFDHVVSLPTDCIDVETLGERRLFSLSNLGFYLLVFKLSVHFTRVRENVDRG